MWSEIDKIKEEYDKRLDHHDHFKTLIKYKVNPNEIMQDINSFNIKGTFFER